MMPMPIDVNYVLTLSRPPTPRPPSPASEQMATLLLRTGVRTSPPSAPPG
jgi:hypothetical protein